MMNPKEFWKVVVANLALVIAGFAAAVLVFVLLYQGILSLVGRDTVNGQTIRIEQNGARQ